MIFNEWILLFISKNFIPCILLLFLKDRDDYIKILRKNIAMFNHLNFEKYSDVEVNNYDIPYVWGNYSFI